MDTNTTYATTREVAERLRVTRATVANLCHRGELTGTRVGSHIRITAASVDAYLERNRIRA